MLTSLFRDKNKGQRRKKMLTSSRDKNEGRKGEKMMTSFRDKIEGTCRSGEGGKGLLCDPGTKLILGESARVVRGY